MSRRCSAAAAVALSATESPSQSTHRSSLASRRVCADRIRPARPGDTDHDPHHDQPETDPREPPPRISSLPDAQHLVEVALVTGPMTEPTICPLGLMTKVSG